MDSIISLLESNDSHWAMRKNTEEDYIQIAERIGYKFNNHKTRHEVLDHLKQKVIESIKGDEISGVNFKKIIDHISLKYHTSKETSHREAFVFLSSLRAAISILPSYTNAASSWQLARNYLEDYFLISSQSPDFFADSTNELKTISDSAIFLKDNGYKISIKSGDIDIDTSGEKRLLKKIKTNFDKLGGHAIEFTLACIAKNYDHKSGRFFLRSEPVTTENYKADTPWGYLFNLALTCLHRPKTQKNHIELFTECVDLSKHYFCIHRLQTFNKFTDSNHSHDTILPAIQKNILYDQHFSIDQISKEHIQSIVSGIFSSQQVEHLNINLALYIDILKWASNKSTHLVPLFFTADELFFDLKYKYQKASIEAALNRLSFKASALNKGYLFPRDIHLRNYFERPFAKLDERYIYINPTLCNYGFYSSLWELCKENGARGNIIGEMTEEFISKTLSKKGIAFLSNKEYSIPKQIRNELQIGSEKGECDFIVETPTKIILIELKRKTLTSEARAGNHLKSIIDISQSLFHALAQAGRHEYILRRQGSIIFKDGTKLELLDRDVERVALSMFGFFGIQDGFFVSQIISSLINAKIDSGNPKEDKEANKYLAEIHSQYMTDVFKETYKSPNNKFMNCRFFSVPQFLEILSNSTSNEEIQKELDRTRHAGTGCKDWFKDYHFLRSLKQPG